MNIVLIETSGNQRFIFATNKLRENVGASELTYRVGTQFVLEAVERLTQKKIYEDDDLSGRRMRANLLDKSKNPELGADGSQVEIITATSGKALLLVADARIGRQIVRAVTEKALREMPGLTVHGAISENFADLKEVHKAIGEVHLKLERIRYEIPRNEQRFLRLPFGAPCATSGLPASKYFKQGPEPAPSSVVSIEKSHASQEGIARLEAVIRMVAEEVRLMKDIDQLERRFKDLHWVAVIHADGNGLGEIFLRFDKHSKSSAREYIEKYRSFSLALDVCTISATGDALKQMRRRVLAEEEEKRWRQGRKTQNEHSDKFIPVVPLVFGGDDLTVICDGQYALQFTRDFLRKFEEETSKSHDIGGNIITEIANNAFGIGRLGICAGVAIIKPHFPFHQAYDLAESLLKSAKQVKDKVKSEMTGKVEQYPCSALDYHVLYDSTAAELAVIRDRLKPDPPKTTWLFARPYIVSDISDEQLEKDVKEPAWFKQHRWSHLERRVAAMLAKDEDGKRKLPNSQLHTLREALFLGKGEADARTKLVKHRYEEEGFNKLLCGKDETLFFQEQRDGEAGHATHFLDALDIVEFRKGEKEEDGRLVDKRPSDAATQPAAQE